MKVHILYGSGEGAKRSYISKLKSPYESDNVTTVDLKVSSLGDLSRSLISPSLFGNDKRLVIVQNLSKNFDLSLLNSDDPSLSVVIVLVGDDATLIKQAKERSFNILEFSGEREITAFAYLDYLLEGKSQAFLELNKLLDSFGGIYIISMIYYGLRRNFLPLPASSFVQKKIINQKSRFNLAKWEELYTNILKAEQDLKTGMGEEKIILTKLTQYFLN